MDSIKVIDVINSKIDKVISDLNKDEYDGKSDYYYYLNQDMPHIKRGLYFCVELLKDANILTTNQFKILNKKIKKIKY